jgi:hypothetical protein
MPNNPIDFVLDSLTWISCAALPMSLMSEMLQNPTSAFFAGSIGGSGFLSLVVLAKFRPEFRSEIAYRMVLVVAGLVLGVVA